MMTVFWELGVDVVLAVAERDDDDDDDAVVVTKVGLNAAWREIDGGTWKESDGWSMVIVIITMLSDTHVKSVSVIIILDSTQNLQ